MKRVYDHRRCTVRFNDSIIALTPQVELRYLNEDGKTYTIWPVRIQKRIDENFNNIDMFYVKRCIDEAVAELKKSIEEEESDDE